MIDVEAIYEFTLSMYALIKWVIIFMAGRAKDSSAFDIEGWQGNLAFGLLVAYLFILMLGAEIKRNRRLGQPQRFSYD